MDKRFERLIDECLRQEESCKYTSTIFYIWLRSIRFWKKALIVLPIIFGGLATWSILVDSGNTNLKFLAASFALLASLIPAIYEALKLDVDIGRVAESAAAFKHLQDRFRIAGNIFSCKSIEEFEKEVISLMDEQDSIRKHSLTPPERFFKATQKKIKSGDYDFQVDIDK